MVAAIESTVMCRRAPWASIRRPTDAAHAAVDIPPQDYPVLDSTAGRKTGEA
jgi:hypothetical protein